MSVKRLFEQFEPENYRIWVELDRTKDGIFSTTTEIVGVLKKTDSITLHAKDLEIREIIFNDKRLKFEINGDELKIFSPKESKFEIGKKISFRIYASGKITPVKKRNFLQHNLKVITRAKFFRVLMSQKQKLLLS